MSLQVRSAAPASRPERPAALRRVLDWMLSLRDAEGRILCPEHRVEHTGKSAGAIVLALELARRMEGAERDELQEAALQQGRRLVANLQREGTSPCFTFRPGRHDPFNCSNSVIDGGACSDALASLARELEGRAPAEELAAFREASLRHARTYLRYAVLDKGVPAQRAWGLTGLAAAWRLEQDSELEAAADEAFELLRGVQHADGSYPYHPREWGAGHPGASDVSAFYQSRVTGFLLHALEELGRDPRAAPHRDALLSSLAFLRALQGPDGVKVGLVEAKPWYWGATHEVASHPFDVYALARGWRHFGDESFGVAALRAWRAWEAHLADDGSPRSHLPGPGRGRSYQCPLFWAGHAMWMARALDDLDAIEEAGLAANGDEGCGGGSAYDLRVEHFEQADLARLEDARVVAWVRGARPAANVAHGSPHGAGLLRVWDKRAGRDLLERCRFGGRQEAEWTGRSGLPAPGRGWRAGAAELRFSFWRSRVHWRAARHAAALRAPLATLRRGVLAFAHPRVSSAFHLAPRLAAFEGGVRLESALAWRDGRPVPGSRLLREFRVDGEGLAVHERCLAAPGVRGLDYAPPAASRELRREGLELSYRLG